MNYWQAKMVKLVDFHECPLFNNLRGKMSAQLPSSYKVDLGISVLEDDFFAELENEGIEIDSLDEINFADDKTLLYKNQRVFVYIRDVHPKGAEIRWPKFHVSSCLTLEEMWRKKRKDRYVLYRGESGCFSINVIKGNDFDNYQKKLDVCRNCMTNINWENYCDAKKDKRNEIVSMFSITDFFKVYPKSLISVEPKYDADTAPLNVYTEDWDEISDKVRQAGQNRCFDCSIELANEHRKYLHVHHIDGQRNNNSKENLKVLCIGCHANEPDHGHMKRSKDYKEFVHLFRRDE